MNIMTNLSALNAARQQGIHSSNFGKSTEKLSSGFKINRAADGAAELGISEQMRAQIRGLNRSVTNADEGQNFIQTGDGAMNEIHDMLQRMRELSVQSINDTNTEADRAALAKEFDALQSEIDRVNTGTYFNTQPVFQEHEDSFYQIGGNRKWKSDQLHTITAPQNDLIINLPDGYDYDPRQYSLTVPNGTYTTQELVDEIEDAFAAMQPENPGFNLEFDQYGYCNLNFEDAQGNMTKIQSVDGTLAYLIYDCQTGYSNRDLVGTTEFAKDSTIKIESGKNDTLQFYLEGENDLKKVVIEPPGEYTICQLKDQLEVKLPPGLTPIIHTNSNGTYSIRIEGEDPVGITGLKGNMFTIEHDNNGLNSIFYDNISPGISDATPAQLIGKAVSNPPITEPFIIKENVNDTLKLKLFTPDGELGPFGLKLDPGSYQADMMAEHLNNLFAKTDILYGEHLDKYLFASDNNGTITIQTHQAAKGYAISVEETPAYNTLFKYTVYPKGDPFFEPGSDPSLAALIGRKDLTTMIPLDFSNLTKEDRTLKIDPGNPMFRDEIELKETYGSMAELESDLNAKLTGTKLDGKIEFSCAGNHLTINAKTDNSPISITTHTPVYEQLLCDEVDAVNKETATAEGTETRYQGQPWRDSFTPAEITLTKEIPLPNPPGYIEVNDTNDTISFILDPPSSTVARTIRLSHGQYNTREDLINELNNQLENRDLLLKASLSPDNHLVLQTKPTYRNGETKTSISINADPNTPYAGSAWKLFLGTTPTPLGPESVPLTDGSKTYITGVNHFFPDGIFVPIEINEPPDGMIVDISLKDGTTPQPPIKIPNNTYTSLESLKNALETAINGSSLKDKISVSLDSNRLKLTAVDKGSNSFSIDPTSKFYKTILGSDFRIEEGTPKNIKSEHSFEHIVDQHGNGYSYIIGREEIRGKQIEIIKDINDTFDVDFTYTPESPPSLFKGFCIPLHANLSEVVGEGTYPSEEIAAKITISFQEQIDKYLENLVKNTDDVDYYDIDFKLDIQVGFGLINDSDVGGIDDSQVLQIAITERTENGQKIESPAGSYTLDSVRGKAAYSIFYASTKKQEFSYAVGSKDISNGIPFEPGKNVFSFTLDGKAYSYTFPENYVSAEQFIDLFNRKLENGEDGNPPLKDLKASIVNGNLRLTYQRFGAHEIRDIRGDAKGLIFYKEDERDDLDPFMLQVGALGHQGLELNRFRVNTMSLGINTVTVSRVKYAEKALDRLDKAIDQLSTRRSTYGALQNRIDFLKSNNKNAAQNVQASESRIRDANMAKEMIDHVKNQITTQASESVLAQANQLPNRIANLLFQ